MVRRPARRIKERMEYQPFRDWLHSFGVCVGEDAFDIHWCEGLVEQSHGPAMGMGTKSPEEESWPACTLLHREWELHDGPFKGWSKEARREFSKAAAERTQADWLKYQQEVPSDAT